MRCPEGLTPGRRAAIHGGVNQYLLDLVDRYAGSKRALHVNAQLVGSPPRRQDRKIQDAPCLAIQTRPAPGVSPCQLGHNALKCHHELVGVGQVRVDVLSTQHISARLKALLEQFALSQGGRVLPHWRLRRSRFSRRLGEAVVRSPRAWPRSWPTRWSTGLAEQRERSATSSGSLARAQYRSSPHHHKKPVNRRLR